MALVFINLRVLIDHSTDRSHCTEAVRSIAQRQGWVLQCGATLIEVQRG